MTSRRPYFALVAAVAVAPLLVLAGCSDQSQEAPPPPIEGAVVPSLDGLPAPSPSASASTFAPPAELKVGKTFTHTAPDGEKMSAQVIARRSESDVEAVEVKFCNIGTVEFFVTSTPWALLFDGGDSEHTIDTSGGGLPAPAYPDITDPRTLTAGKCARGWINWEPIEGKKPYGVAYKVEDDRVVWKF